MNFTKDTFPQNSPKAKEFEDGIFKLYGNKLRMNKFQSGGDALTLFYYFQDGNILETGGTHVGTFNHSQDEGWLFDHISAALSGAK